MATIVALALLLVCWWFLSYRSLLNYLQQARVQALQLEQLKSVPTITPDAHEETVIPELKSLSIEETFKQRTAAFFTVPSMREALSKILAYAQQEKLLLGNYLVSDEHPKEWYACYDVKLVLVGKVFNVVNFFERLQKYDNIVIQQCEMVLEDSLTRCTCTLVVMLI